MFLLILHTSVNVEIMSQCYRWYMTAYLLLVFAAYTLLPVDGVVDAFSARSQLLIRSILKEKMEKKVSSLT
jgi:hypothetical protein